MIDRLLLAALSACALAVPAWAERAWVERVVDGDTVHVRNVRGRETVRIFGIDAPERRQPGGNAARAALVALVGDRVVDVLPVDRDRYGRLVARIREGERDVGEAMVEAGHAWQFTRYDDGRQLRDAQTFARRARIGLWAQADAAPPWQWRAAGRAPERSPARSGSCRPAPVCSRLTSCQGALDALARCGAGRLDGDRDGIPCEALCRLTGDPMDRSH